MLIGEDRFYLETITRPRGLTVVRSLVRDPRKPCFESKPVMLLGKVLLAGELVPPWRSRYRR